ncbi:hypothetical protein [Mycobacterium sp. MMS18-G62]
MTIGLVASACSGSSDSGTKTTTEAATSATSSSTAAATTSSAPATTATAAPGGADLQSLIPAPPNSQQTKGPDNIADNGIHMYFQVNGSPTDVMSAYKTALEGKGWQVTTVVTSGGGGGGGATYSGTNGDAYGVFDGGGYNATTYVDVCTWPTKPANPICNRGDR